MPHVSKHDQVLRKGVHSNKDHDVLAFEDTPRDDLRGAYGGNENEGPARTEKSHLRSSKLKSRASKASKGRVPIR